MKKLTIAFLLSLSCACALAAAGCKDSSDSSSSGGSSNTTGKGVAVEFTEGEGYTFLCDIDKEDATTGTTLPFRLKRSAFYTGDPVVYMNGEPLAYVEKSSALVWEYSVELTEDVTFTVAESSIRKDVSNMAGSGTMSDAFVITKPVDLLYIAQQVNAGVRTYCAGAYVLGADIDCGGETLEVIGDGSTANSFFSGCVSCVVDAESGEVQEKYTIKNFKISTDDINNVGLFGTVLADPSVASSGLFYGIRLDDFSITATSASLPESDRSIVAGSLIGYGQGANMYLCESTNGEVNIVGDNTYFSFVGGLIGYQQGVYMSAYNAFFPSEVTYATVDVDVNILSGMSLYAGGISGYLASNYPLGSNAFVHNSIATGSVTGALRAGGLVGGLGRYTSVGNCYATGNVSAYNSQSVKDPLISSTEYCYAYAGGLVGYAENDTIVNDCFYTGNAQAIARSGAAYANADDYVGGGAQQGSASAVSQKYIVDTCVSGDEIVLSNIAYFTNALGWQDYDWVFAANKLPEIEYDTADASVITPKATLTLKYVAADGTKILMGKEESKSYTYFDATTSANSYVPMGNFFYNGSLSLYLASDSVNGVNYLSYGYYLDEACTKKVPYSYVPTKNITLYIGFADASDICGEYTYVNGDKAVMLAINKDGTVTYTDGNTTQTSYFLYDGETLIIEGARLARYYDGEIVVEEDDVMVTENFDMYRYNYYDYRGSVKDGTLTLYDGTYFTADNPFVAKTGVTLEKEYDDFKGEWTKSASVNKFYSFDGKGNWTYSHVYYDRSGSLEKQILEENSGTYTYDEQAQTLALSNGATARFNAYGFLEITLDGETETYYAGESYVGSWKSDKLTLVLEGIGSLGYGKAVATYANGTSYELVYEQSETDGYVALYMPHEEYVKDLLFGYFTYDVNKNVLSSVLYSLGSEAEYEAIILSLVDDYNGEWIGNLSEFDELDFNGNGLYGFLNGGDSGSVTVTSPDGKKTTVPYSLDSALNGSFVYNGNIYLLSYSERTETVTVQIHGGATVEMNRKDLLANVDFVDLSGNYYKFNGKSTLGKGAFTVTSDSLASETYDYRPSATGFDVLSGENVVGKLVRTETCYELTINDVKQELYVKNEFMGNWAISGKFDTFQIGATNLKGEIMAEFDGNKVVMSYLSPSMLTFFYRDKGNNMPITYYVYLITDQSVGRTVLVLSEYTDLYSGEYTICAPANELYGKWTQIDETGAYKDRAICFDGVTSGYVNGVSKITNKFGETLYYYTIREKGIMMWSQDQLAGKTVYYKVKMIDKSEYTAEQLAGAYVLDDKAFFLIEIDGLFLTEATDKDDNVYFFDGEGNLEVNGEVQYTYTVLSYNTGNTVSLHITDIVTNKTYEAELDYSDSSNVLFTIFEEVIA